MVLPRLCCSSKSQKQKKGRVDTRPFFHLTLAVSQPLVQFSGSARSIVGSPADRGRAVRPSQHNAKPQVFPGTESAHQPAEEMSERHDHGKDSSEKIRIQSLAKAFIGEAHRFRAMLLKGAASRRTRDQSPAADRSSNGLVFCRPLNTHESKHRIAVHGFLNWDFFLHYVPMFEKVPSTMMEFSVGTGHN